MVKRDPNMDAYIVFHVCARFDFKRIMFSNKRTRKKQQFRKLLVGKFCGETCHVRGECCQTLKE